MLAPKGVVAVEAVFQNGRTVRESTDRGVFAIVEPGRKQSRELRVLDVDGRVL